MGVRRKAGVGGDLVVVPHPQGAVAHVLRIVVVREREVMLRLQPAVVGAAELCKWFEFDHGMSFLSILAILWDFDQALKPPSTFSTVPVTNEASGLARKATPAATSSGRP